MKRKCIKRKWTLLAGFVFVLMGLTTCGSWEQSADAGETELPEKLETTKEILEETEPALLEYTVVDFPCWDIFQGVWDVRDGITYVVRDEMDGAAGEYHFVISGVDPQGNVVEEIPVDLEEKDRMFCGSFVAESDGTFSMYVNPPDSLNDDAPERESHYLQVDSQGNVIKDVLAKDYGKELLPEYYRIEEGRGIRCVAVSVEGWECASLTPDGEYTEILVWNPQGEFVGGIPTQHYSWIMTSGSGKIYGIVDVAGGMVFTEIHPESLQFARESVLLPLDHLRYLQAGNKKEFITLDEFGVVEFSLEEEPVRILNFEDYGLEPQFIRGLQVRGDEILLIEEKTEGEKIPQLWTFQRTAK